MQGKWVSGAQVKPWDHLWAHVFPVGITIRIWLYSFVVSATWSGDLMIQSRRPASHEINNRDNLKCAALKSETL